MQLSEKHVIDDATKHSTPEKLFDFIAQCLSDFIKKYEIKEKLPLGFTFSFAVYQRSLTSGTLIRAAKDFTALEKAKDKEVVKLLKDAIFRRKVNLSNSMCVCMNALGLEAAYCVLH